MAFICCTLPSAPTVTGSAMILSWILNTSSVGNDISVTDFQEPADGAARLPFQDPESLLLWLVTAMIIPFLVSQECGMCLYAQPRGVYLYRSLRLAGATLARKHQFFNNSFPFVLCRTLLFRL